MIGRVRPLLGHPQTSDLPNCQAAAGAIVGVARAREGFGRVEQLAGLQAVVEAAEEPVEQVAHRRGVLVTGRAATVVVLLDLR